MPRKRCSWPELSPGPLQQIDPYDRSAVPVVPAAARPTQHALDVRFGNVPPGFGSSPKRRGEPLCTPRPRSCSIRDDSNGAAAVSCQGNTIGSNCPNTTNSLNLLQNPTRPPCGGGSECEADRPCDLTVAGPLAIGPMLRARGAQERRGFA
jgi:hypothetical protein